MMLSRLHSSNNGVRRLLYFKSPWPSYSTKASTAAAAARQPTTQFMAAYLMNSLGFSKTEALSTQKKVTSYKRFNRDPNLVINYFHQELGLTKSQIKTVISSTPQLLFYNVDKTLKPKVRVFQDFGLSGSDFRRVLMHYKNILTRGLETDIIAPINCLRELLGSDENAAKVVRNFTPLLNSRTPERVKLIAGLLRKFGFSHENVVKFIVNDPRWIIKAPELLEEVVDRVENEFGIPRESKMFFYGVRVLFGLKKSTIDEKFRMFRRCGWSNDADVYSMVRRLPIVLTKSEDRIRKTVEFFVGELGYTHEYLTSHPTVFNLSLERRVKPRCEVLQVLNEKKLMNRKRCLYNAVVLPELKFVDLFLLPYKDEIPEVYDSYIKSVAR
ncbi:hypothetical protein ACH5RR_026746 [Cinchona calisaya]|uniref:Mitochondrial transcription termination factor n=1 Tax=Cinchona calisaya TaxID=153742 RepID=A0ABD2Z5G3_9GENT